MRSYSIGELAREFAVTARTIRHYEEIGRSDAARHASILPPTGCVSS